jgi:hypothetical protein
MCDTSHAVSHKRLGLQAGHSFLSHRHLCQSYTSEGLGLFLTRWARTILSWPLTPNPDFTSPLSTKLRFQLIPVFKVFASHQSLWYRDSEAGFDDSDLPLPWEMAPSVPGSQDRD